MYWLQATTSLIGDYNYNSFVDMRDNYYLTTMSKYREILNRTDKEGASANLKTVNQELADYAYKMQSELLGEMVKKGSNHMILRYDFND
jgi:dipeptidase